MKREDLEELHYIALIETVPSICKHGILSHKRAMKLSPKSIAKQAVQDIRAKVVVPGGRRLHEYANLYFHARNPMMFLRKARHAELCVLRVGPDVLDLPGVVVTDGNASSKYCRWGAGASGLRLVHHERTFAQWWTDQDEIEQMRKASAKCAEVLVPDVVAPTFLVGAYVSCVDSAKLFGRITGALQPTVNPDMFFR